MSPWDAVRCKPSMAMVVCHGINVLMAIDTVVLQGTGEASPIKSSQANDASRQAKQATAGKQLVNCESGKADAPLQSSLWLGD